MGELGLDGTLRHTEGILPMVGIAQRSGMDTVFVPFEDAPEAAVIDGVTVIPVRTVGELAAHLSGERPIRPYVGAPPGDDEVDYPFDFADVRGQEHVRRALEVAAAGGHNYCLSGTPGSGKTLMARALPSILPPMTGDEALDVTKIYAIGGMLPPGTPLLRRRPFRAPHHTISQAGAGRRRQGAAAGRDLAGAPRRAVPGRAARVRPQALEVLRQPLEDRTVTISRAAGTLYVSGQLHARRGDESVPLRVAQRRRARLHLPAGAVARYGGACRGRCSTASICFVEVPRVTYEKLSSERQGEASAAVRAARGRSARAAGAPAARHRAADQRRDARRPRCASGAAPTTAAQTLAARGDAADCSSRRAATIACSSWRARSPTWRAAKTSAPRTSPRRCSTGPGGWSKRMSWRV